MEDKPASDVVSVRKCKRRRFSAEELESLSREELVNRVIQLELHRNQLKNIISKSCNSADGLGNDSKKRKFDFSRCCKRHVLLKILYLGWDYQGYTTQEDTTNTIEHHLFSALTKCCLIESRQTSNYNRCGRTDKGVSSFSQVVSLDIRSKFSGDVVEGELNYPKLLNRVLPKDIKVLAWCPVAPEMSARFDCKERTYKYFFPRGNLDIEAMNAAVQHVVGLHDFRNLCKMDVANGVVKYERKIISAKVNVLTLDTPNGCEAYDMCELTLVGQAYLWHQVRCIMGVLLLVGEKKENVDVLKELLDVEKHPRKPQYFLSSDVPLNLFHCEFDSTNWVISQEVLIGVIHTLQQEWTMHSVKSSMLRLMLKETEGMLSEGIVVKSQCAPLLQGVQSRVYQPLFERPTCSSLENRIEHYKKKRKIEVPSEEKSTD